MVCVNVGNYLPVSGSTPATVSVTASPSLSYISFEWFDNCIMNLIEEDKVYQLRQRKLRYSPFNVKPKAFVKSRLVINRPRLFQIMPRLHRIGKEYS